MWGQQLTLQEWPDGAWVDGIRLDYYTLDASKSGDPPTADEWAYGLSDHTSPDASPQTAWSPPVIKKRQGYRVYEVLREYTVRGEALASVEYDVELGPKKSFRLTLYCRRGSFKGYVPY